MKYRHRLAWIVLLPLLLLSAVVWLLVDELLTPQRAPWTEADWHSWYAGDNGVRVERFACDAGAATCLLLTADATQPINRRGALLRAQLAAQGVALPAYGKADRLLLMLHGKNSRKEHLLSAALRYVALGYVVVLFDLPAHGASPRDTMCFAVCADEADFVWRVLQAARGKLGVADMPAQLWAMSLGSVYANRAVARHPDAFRSLVVVSGLDRLDAVLSNQVAWLPTLLSIRLFAAVDALLHWRSGVSLHDVRPVQWVADVTIPALVVHGDADTLIDLTHARALYQAYRSKDKALMVVEGGGHSDLMLTPAPTYAAIAAFLLRHR